MKGTLAATFLVSATLVAAGAGCGNLEDVSTTATAIGYMPDGTLVVFTPAGIKLYDAVMKHEKRSIQLAETAGTENVPESFSLARDGSAAAVSFSGTVHRDIVVYAMPSGQVLSTIDVDLPAFQPIHVQRVTLSPHGDLVYVRAGAPGMYRVSDGVRLWGVDGIETALDPVVFSADGATLYGVAVVGVNPSHTAFEAHDALTGALLYSVDAGGAMGQLVMGADGATVIGTEFDPCLPEPSETCVSYVFRSAGDGTVLKTLPQFSGLTGGLERGGSGAVDCSTAGEFCASGAAVDLQHPVALTFKTDGTLVRQLPTLAGVFALVFSPDGAELAVASGDARVFRVSDGALISRQSYTYGVF